MATIQTTFRARNQNPTIKALAESAAVQKSVVTGKPFKVIYRDHFNDYSVVGDYVVVPA
jgi:hypothetical protein